MLDSLWPHGNLQHTRIPCPSLSPGVCWNLYPLSQWCHPIIWFSAALFSFCLQSFLASGSFPMSQLFSSAGQRTGVLASASVLPMQSRWLTICFCRATGSQQSRWIFMIICHHVVLPHANNTNSGCTYLSVGLGDFSWMSFALSFFLLPLDGQHPTPPFQAPAVFIQKNSLQQSCAS